MAVILISPWLVNSYDSMVLIAVPNWFLKWKNCQGVGIRIVHHKKKLIQLLSILHLFRTPNSHKSISYHNESVSILDNEDKTNDILSKLGVVAYLMFCNVNVFPCLKFWTYCLKSF